MNDLTALVIIVVGVACTAQFTLVVIALLNRDNKPLMDKLIALEVQLTSIEEKALALAATVSTNTAKIAINTSDIKSEAKVGSPSP